MRKYNVRRLKGERIRMDILNLEDWKKMIRRIWYIEIIENNDRRKFNECN